MKHHSLLAIAAALTAILLLPDPGLAQGRTGGVFGIVSDETGAYRLTLSESGLDHVGTYEVELLCLVGSCP